AQQVLGGDDLAAAAFTDHGECRCADDAAPCELGEVGEVDRLAANAAAADRPQWCFDLRQVDLRDLDLEVVPGADDGVDRRLDRVGHTAGGAADLRDDPGDE